MTNDNTNSVSYLAIAFTGAWKKGEPVETQNANDATLSDNDKDQLLKLARGTLEYVFKNGKPPAPADLGIEITPGMEQIMGAFVTLKENGQLRGCIGEIIPARPLYKAVIAQAVNAAFNDSRFPQVEASELPLIEIEISALTPSKPVASYKDIVIGKHGMTLEKRGRRAVFLPQVAPEQGWGIDETLTHLATKAGLAPNDWKEGASFTVFEAIVFHEKEK
jgi:AmmeMemoRadiSam system protein A